MPRNGDRIPKSESTRLKILACAVDEIVAHGSDRVGFTAIAKRAGLSTGALYARYENVDELLIDVWLREGLSTMRGFLNAVVDASVGESRNASQVEVTRSLNNIPASLAVAVDLMVISHRNETLAEVVVPSFRHIMDDLIDRMAHAPMLVSLYLGQLLMIRGTHMENLEWSRIVRDLSDIASEKFIPSVPNEILEFPKEPLKFDLDETDTKLFEGVSSVIASVGVDNATISRIARRAEINPASIYMRYEDKEVMLRRAIQVVYLSSTLRNAAMLERMSKKFTNKGATTALFRATAADSNREQRLLRMETMHAAAHQEFLGRVMFDLYEGSVARDVAVQNIQSHQAMKIQRPYTLFVRANFFGIAILREFGYVAPDDPYMEPFLDRLTARMTKSAEKLAELTRSDLLK